VLIASWNINSIRARRDLVDGWLREHQPDVLCLQETKVVDDEFPGEVFQRQGYELAVAGQRSYNGVAIAARAPLRDVKVGLHDGAPDDDRRLIAATVAGIRFFSVYVPNGKSVQAPEFETKLSFLERLQVTLARELETNENAVLCGDFNVALEERDVYDPERYQGQLHFHPAERARLQRLLELGLVDAFRLHEPRSEQYSWWDYRGASLRRNEGLRIDYVFVTQPLARRCRTARIDAAARNAPKPSDHAPVIVVLD
jgi:exodeoxyribonuclease-3